MTTKKSKTLPKSKTPKTALTVKDEPDHERLKAKTYLSPSVSAMSVVKAYSPECGLDLAEMVFAMRDFNKAVADDDMRRVEAMLLGQAHALQSMFADLAYRAKHQTGLAAIQTIMGLALKAQSQCRATLQTLSDVKYPKQATFIKQANIASQQQVNNGAHPPSTEHSAREEKPKHQNELLKDTSHETKIIGMDTGTARQTIGADPHLETVGAINRPAVKRRQGAQ